MDNKKVFNKFIKVTGWAILAFIAVIVGVAFAYERSAAGVLGLIKTFYADSLAFVSGTWRTVTFVAVACTAVVIVFTAYLMYKSVKKRQSNVLSPLSLLLGYMVVMYLIAKREAIRVIFNGSSTRLAVGIVMLVILALFIILIVAHLYASCIAIIYGPDRSPKKEVEESHSEDNTPSCGTSDPKPVTSTASSCGASDPIETRVEEEEKEVEETPAPACGTSDPVLDEKVEEHNVVEPSCGTSDPVEETAPVETIVAPKASNEDSGAIITYDENGNKVYINRTFEKRLEDAGEDLLKQYSDIKNEFLSYRKVHSRISKTNDAYRYEGKLIAKVIVAGKGLKIYLALDPMSVDSAIYHQRDASTKKKFAETPLVIRVKSPLSLRKAITLINSACEKVGTTKKSRYTPVDYSKPENFKKKRKTTPVA